MRFVIYYEPTVITGSVSKSTSDEKEVSSLASARLITDCFAKLIASTKSLM